MAGTARKLDGTGRDVDHVVVFHDARWADYERLLRLRGEKATPRITFLEGALEIMSPSLSHEAIKSTLGRLVEAWCLEHDVTFGAYGSRAPRRAVPRIETSKVLPGIDLPELARFADRVPTSAAIRAYRSALRRR